LNVNNSGSAGSPITYGAYGTGNKPQIRAVGSAVNWAQYQGNIYVATLASPPASVNQVFVDGSKTQIARWPNSGFTDYTILPEGNANRENTFIDSDCGLTANQVSGSSVVIRTHAWWLEPISIQSFNSATGTFTLSKKVTFPMVDESNHSYYLYNKLWMLDQAGEWYYDAAQGKLYIWLEDSGNPNSHTIEFSSSNNQYGIYNRINSYTNIEDISIFGASVHGVSFGSGDTWEGPNNTQIARVDVSYSGNTGIMYYYSTGSTIKDCNLDKNAVQGIEGRYFFGGYIQNNSISDTGRDRGSNTLLMNQPVGLNMSQGRLQLQDGSVSYLSYVKNNKVYNSAYIGINNSMSDAQFENNLVDGACTLLSDCGGLYNYDSDQVATHGASFKNNIVRNIQYNENHPDPCIYLDNGSINMTVSGNTAVDCPIGIYLSHTNNCTVEDNVIYRYYDRGIQLTEGMSVPGAVMLDKLRNNTLRRNTIYGRGIFGDYFLKGGALYFDEDFPEGVANYSWGTSNDNNIFQPFEEYVVGRSIANSSNRYKLSTWQTMENHNDVNSKNISSSYSANPGSLGDNLLTYNSSFDTDTGGWYTYPSANLPLSLGSSAECGLDGTCAKIAVNQSGTNGLFYSSGTNDWQRNLFGIEKGAYYKISLSARAASAPVTLKIAVSNSGQPYHEQEAHSYTVTTTRQDMSFIFLADETFPVSPTGMRVEIYNAEPNRTYYVDSVSVKKFSGSDPSNLASLFYNDTDATKRVSLSGKYCDVSNQIVEGNLTLAPYASKFLLNCFNNSDGICNNRETAGTAPGDCNGDGQVPAAPTELQVR
jgi:parallel beta-helix repeat protein